MARKKQATPLSSDAITALRSSSFDGNSFALPEGHLDCYDEVKALMAAIGGKWMSKKKRMVFQPGVDCKMLVLAACDRGEIPPSNPLDFFPTMPDVVEELKNSPWLTQRWPARIISAEMDGRPVRYLEPNGGSGAFVAVMVAKMRPQDELVICELNPLLAAMLRASYPQAKVIEGDFLEYTDAGKFDVILMNPPFDGKAYQKHVKHAESMLARNGVLVSIVPSSFMSHGDDFIYNVAERGEWQDLGGDRFKDTDTATTAIFIENDPDAGWREEACSGYSTHHAWDAAMSIGNDNDMRESLGRARDFAGIVAVLQSWASKLLKNGSCIRMDEGIACETVAGIVENYCAPELTHLLKMLPGGATSNRPVDEVIDEEVAPQASPVTESPEATPSPEYTKAEQGEFVLV